jgi:hypothetical protein
MGSRPGIQLSLSTRSLLVSRAWHRMTYNFDPDRWYENQRRALDAERDRGTLTPEQYQAGLDDLERRLDQMSSRLDKPFDLSGRPRTPARPPRG